MELEIWDAITEMILSLLPYLSLIGSAVMFFLTKKQRDANLKLVEAGVRGTNIDVSMVTTDMWAKLFNALQQDYDRLREDYESLLVENRHLKTLLKNGNVNRMYPHDGGE